MIYLVVSLAACVATSLSADKSRTLRPGSAARVLMTLLTMTLSLTCFVLLTVGLFHISD